MLPALLVAVAAASAPLTLELHRGAAIPASISKNPEFRYWAVEDTTLNSTNPDGNEGGYSVIEGGPGKTILIQFKDLNRTLGPNRKITDAKLVLTLTSGKVSGLQVGRVLQPWNEGPIRTLKTVRPSTQQQAEAARWSATWRHRRAGAEAVGWQNPGANGAGDVRWLQGITGKQPQEDLYVVEGLGPELQAQYERWYENHGFALKFDEAIEFLSSQATTGKPVLVLQIEDVAPSSGPDLSVTYIERTPEYERYDDRQARTTKEQNGQEVPIMDNVPNASSKKWPFDGEELNYTAHVKNVGKAAAEGFSAQWLVSERPRELQDVAKTLAPGEETTFQIKLPFRNIHSDHRVLPLGLRIRPKGADATAGNDYLEIHQNALNLGIYVEQSVFDAYSAEQNLLGSRSFEDWLQAQLRVLNEGVFPYSRFSFAPDGVLERLRVQKIAVVPDGTLKGSSLTPDGQLNLNFDAEFGFAKFASTEEATARLSSGLETPDRALFKNLSTRLGIVDLTPLQIKPSTPFGDGQVKIKEAGQAVTRGSVDRFPGIMGGGDTRAEGHLLASFQVPYEPYLDPAVAADRMEPTDLFSATDVAGWNSNLGRRRGYSGDYLYDVPSSVLLTVMDLNGRRIANTQLSLYQMSNGVIEDKLPVAMVTTSASGTVTLTPREIAHEGPFTTFTSHSLRANPFGRIDTRGTNGVMLVKATANGVTEWGWLKLWQLVDTFHRGQSSIALMQLRLNLPAGALEEGTDLAKGKTVTDSGNTAPSTLAALLSGTSDTEVALPSAADSWVELDLGRDRAIGEIQLLSRSPEFYKSFEIRVYETAQTADQAKVWTREVDWDWTVRNRRDVSAAQPEVTSVAYRAAPLRARYIRIVNKGGAIPKAGLAGIRVTPLKLTSP